MLSIMEMHPIKAWDGPAIHVLDLIKGFKRHGQNVILVSTCSELLAPVKVICPVYQFACKKNERFRLWHIPQLARIIRQNNIDILHTHGGWNTWIALLASLLAGRGKVVNSWHGARAIQNDILHRWFYEYVTIIVASESLRARMTSSGIIKDITVIPHGIDTKRFTTCETDKRAELEIPAEAFVAGFIGRVCEEKGVEYVIEAVNRLDGVYLIIAGWEDHEPAYTARVKKMACDRIKFCGYKQDVVPYVAAIDTIVLPTIIPETFGLVVPEALSMGKPAIVTDTGGQAEIVTDGGNGFIVKPRSAKAIAEKIDLLAKDHNLYSQMSQHARDMAKAEFSVEAMGGKTLALFEKILDKS